MTFLKAQVIVNPESNCGRTRRRWKEIRDAIKSFFREFKVEFTERPLQATEIARSAIKEGLELIIGVGGDGTANEIANGFIEGQKLINPGSTLGIIPSGTGCDLCRSLGIPSRTRDALEAITRAPSVRMDIGRVVFCNPDGKREERYFLNVADFGVGAQVVKEVNQRRLNQQPSSYLRCLLSVMSRFRSKRMKILVDGKQLPEGEFLVGAVANGRILGKGMKIAPSARLDDGLFDFVLVKGMKFAEFLRHGWKVFFGTHLGHPKISLWRAEKIEATGAGGADVLLELDGELPGTLPASFEILPRFFPIKGYI